MEIQLKKAMVYDLDNTLYPVNSIGHELFAPLFQLIEDSGNHQDQMEEIKKDIMRKPFQEVAHHYGFDDQLKSEGLEMLKDLTYEKNIEMFDDYYAILELPGDRFLVTTGFKNMQDSKIKQMGIEQDFKEIYVVDPSISDLSKKDIFSKIMEENRLAPSEMMVIGDDPDSEIKAAEELGIETVLYNKLKLTDHPHADHIINDFRELVVILTK